MHWLLSQKRIVLEKKNENFVRVKEKEKRFN